MINAFFQAIMSFVFSMIDFFATPIDNYLTAYLPQVESFLSDINGLQSLLNTYIGYVVDLTCLPSATILLIISYWTFALTVPLVVWVIKWLVKWWHYLAP